MLTFLTWTAGCLLAAVAAVAATLLVAGPSETDR